MMWSENPLMNALRYLYEWTCNFSLLFVVVDSILNSEKYFLCTFFHTYCLVRARHDDISLLNSNISIFPAFMRSFFLWSLPSNRFESDLKSFFNFLEILFSKNASRYLCKYIVTSINGTTSWIEKVDSIFIVNLRRVRLKSSLKNSEDFVEVERLKFEQFVLVS